MLLNDDIYGEDNKVLMKCDRCGCEMAKPDGDDKLSCICMECGKGTMYQINK